MLESVTEEDLRAVVQRLVASAKAGERWAIRELLDRTVGKGIQPVELETCGERDPTELDSDQLIAYGIENDLVDLLPPGLLHQAVTRGLIDPDLPAQVLELQRARDTLRRHFRESKVTHDRSDRQEPVNKSRTDIPGEDVDAIAR